MVIKRVETHSRPPLEVETINTHALLSGRAIIAGLLIAMFTLLGFVGMGLAFGGIGLDEDTTAKSAGIFTGVWFIGSILISLFVGSYFAARVSKFRTGRIGSAQGLVIASLFLGFLLYQGIGALGSLGSAAGSMLGKSGSAIMSGAQSAADNNAVSSTVSNLAEDALGDLSLRSAPTVVAEGLGARLLRGDTESAKNYLAFQAGLTPEQADARIAQVKAQADKVMDETKEKTAVALRSTGLTLFLLVFLGALSALAGGALGSVVNFRKPLIRNKEDYYPQGEHA